MASDIKLLDDNQIVVEGNDLFIDRGAEESSVSLSLKNPTGFWHISGPRTYDPGNPLSIFWNDNKDWLGPYLTINTAGSVGISGFTSIGGGLEVLYTPKTGGRPPAVGAESSETIFPIVPAIVIGSGVKSCLISAKSETGNVGIGTANPQRKLDVIGDARLTGGLTASNLQIWIPNPSIQSLPITIKRPGQTETKSPQPANPQPAFIPALMVEPKTGNVGIGTPNPEKTLDVSGDARITGNITATTVTQTSSRALKENIAEISAQEAVSALTNLNPVKFNFKSDAAKESHVGFIAEDVPELVAMADRKTLSSMDIVAVLTKVVQEQQQAISALTAKVQALSNTN